MRICTRRQQIGALRRTLPHGSIAAALSIALGLSNVAHAQQPGTDFSRVEIKTTALGHDAYMLEGQGGNITVTVARDGIVLVDTEYLPLHDRIRAAIAKVSSAPIRYAIDTHFHIDHSGGNAGFAGEGAVVVAQENVRKRLVTGAAAGLTPATPAVSGAALPTKLYRDSLTLRLKGVTATLRHAPHAHTDGDTYVFFREPNLLATGDVVSFGRYPNIDVDHGGSIAGMIAACGEMLALANGATRIVPGHGPAGDRKALVDYRAMLIDARARMAKLIKAGKSEEEAVAARPYADDDQKFAASGEQRDHFIRVMYRAVKAG